MENTAEHVDSATVNFMWKVLHSRWKVVLWVEWSVLQWAVCGSFFPAGGKCYCVMNGVWYSKHYVESPAHEVDSDIVCCMWCVTVNIMRKVLLSRWSVVLWVECSVLQLTLCGRYCTAGGQLYCGLNGVCYSEQYVECISEQVDKLLWVEWSVLQWTVSGSYSTAGGQLYFGWMKSVTVNIMWRILHSWWIIVLWVEWSVIKWTLCGRYCTAGGQCYCGLNGVS